MAMKQPVVGGRMQGVAFEKSKARSWVILKRLWQYLRTYKWLLTLAVFLSILGNFLALLGPKLSGYAIDAIGLTVGQVDFKTVFFYAGLMIGFYLLSALLSYLLSFLMIRLSRDTVYRMRRDVFEHLLRLPISFFDSHATGDVLSVLSYDIDTVNASLSHDLVQLLTSLFTIVGSFLMMCSISPALLSVFLLTIPLSILFTKRRTKQVQPLYRTRSAKLGALNGYAEEITSGLKSIKAYHSEAAFLAAFEERNQAACTANYAAGHLSSSTGPTVNFIGNLSLAFISLFSALLYMSGHISLGNVSSFVLYSRKFSGPINEFANIISELQSALAAAERVFRLLDEPEESADAPEAETLSHVKGAVSLEQVQFGYVPGAPVLRNFTLAAKPGQLVALVGPTGMGKTTVINLLMRFYDADAGKITIDGKDILHLSRQSLRKAFSMVLQESWLFSGSIFENLAYGKENVTRAEVAAAAKAAKIHTFIEALPQGYDTQLQEGGSNISKGQKQLLTIARAMLLEAPMLILDEATSNVDTQTERRIQAAMRSLMAGRTCFVIAHRLSTIQNADLIAVIKDGSIGECGTHQALLQEKGEYAALYNAQFDVTEPLS